MSFLGRWLCVLLCGLLIGAPTAAYAAPRQSAQTPFNAIFAAPAPAGAALPVSRHGVKDCGLRQPESRSGVPYLYDGHGSVRGLADAAGNVTDSYDYDAYGNLIGRTGASDQPYLYAGERFVAELGLYYNRARYYDESVGRFVNMDPFEGYNAAPMSLHKYLYGESDPINNIDPTGRSVLTAFGYSRIMAVNLTYRVAMAFPAIMTAIELGTFAAVVGAELVMLGVQAYDFAFQYKNPNHGTNKSVAAYEVDDYNDLRRRIRKNKQGHLYDVHHAPQQAAAKGRIPGYNANTGPGVVLPKDEHGQVNRMQSNVMDSLHGKRSGRPADAARLVVRDLNHIRNHTKAPPQAMRQLTSMVHYKYPGVFQNVINHFAAFARNVRRVRGR